MKKTFILLLLLGIFGLLASGCGHSEGTSAIIGGGPGGAGPQNPGTINGTVWKDLNQDKVINPGETGIPEITVDLFKDSNGNGSLDSTDEFVATTTTDADGNYSFTVTSTGRYFVSVLSAPATTGWILTTNDDEPTVSATPFGEVLGTLRADVTSLNVGISNINFGFFSPVKWGFNISPNAAGPAFPSPFVSSPAVSPDNTIYVGSGNHSLFAINADGTLKWEYETGAAISASPAIGSDGTVYAGSYDRQLYALRPDGTLKWVFPTKTVLSSSPAIAKDGTIYAGGTNLDKLVYGCVVPVTVTIGRLYAINPDGSKKWEFVLSGIVQSSPAVGSDGTIYIASEGDILNDRSVICDPLSDFPPSSVNPNVPVNGHLYAINPDGSLKWEFRALGPIDSSVAIGADGTIYVGSDGIARGYGSTKNSFVPLSPATVGYLYALTPGGQLKWYTDLFGNVKSSPAIGNDGTIYVGSDKEDFFALTPAGAIKWQFPTRGPVRSSPALASDGTIFVGSNDGSLYALNPDGTLKTRFIITETGTVNSSPNIGADGTIYFATGGGDDKVYAIIGNSILAQTPWPKFRRDLINTGRQ